MMYGVYGCMAVYRLYALYILTGASRDRDEASRCCIRMEYSQILYTLLYGEVMYRPPRWTVFETFERLSPR
jgi:hypothetical protein